MAVDDGRIFVVEYKGEHLRYVPSEIEKDQVGRLWAERSLTKCLFIMVFVRDQQDRNIRQQLDAVIDRYLFSISPFLQQFAAGLNRRRSVLIGDFKAVARKS